MQPGEFARRLKVLNPALRVCCFNDSSKLAGLYVIDSQGEWFDICGVDKGWVPEYTEWDSVGHIVKSGWRRVYLLLIQLGFTTPERVRKVCPGFFLRWSQARVDEDRRVQIVGDPIAAKMMKMADNAPVQRWMDPDTKTIEEGTALTADQNLELAADIQAKDPEWKKEEAVKDRWFLETWKERGGNSSDKPNY